MKKTVLFILVIILPVISMLSCSKKILPSGPGVSGALSTPTPVSNLGSISGTVKLLPFICQPCAPLPGYPILLATATPGGPTETPTETPTIFITYTPVPTATIAYAGAIVKAFLNGVEKASAVSDVDGKYTLSNLDPGYYSLQVTYPQYDIVNCGGVTVTANTDNSGNDLATLKLWTPGKLIVMFNGAVTDAQARQSLEVLGCVIDTAYTNNPDFLTYFITIPADKTPPQMETIINALPGIRSSGRETYGCACPA